MNRQPPMGRMRSNSKWRRPGAMPTAVRVGMVRRRAVSASGTRARRVVEALLIAAPILSVTLPLAAQPSAKSSGYAVVVPIRTEINDVVRESFERRLKEATEHGARTIIVELKTPGGAVLSALEICRLIKNLPADVRTIAWVHNEAYSAGAMISIACKEIWMSPSSAIGDCAPIMVSPTGGLEELPATERAKAESPVLQEFRDSATRNGYDPVLCRAMVTVGEEVWWIENIKSGDRRFVVTAEKKELIDDLDAEKREWRLVRSFIDPLSQHESRVNQPVDSKDTLLTLSQSEAVGYGFAKGIAQNLGELSNKLELSAVPTMVEVSGWERFVFWLNSPLIRGILLFIAIIGGYIEFHTPGLIMPGITALIALAIFVGAPYAAGLADVWTIIVLLIGLGLLAVEIFVLPGFGVAGILGGLMILVSFVGTFITPASNTPTFSGAGMQANWDQIKLGLTVVLSSFVAAGIGILFLAKYLPHLPFARKLMLENPDGAKLTLSELFANVAQPGDIGLVIAPLRPGGKARFGQEIVVVSSQGEYVDAGAKVQVVRRDGPLIVVRTIDADA